MTQSIDKRFPSIIESWYLLNKRELPWRNTVNPYYIWLSEVILQQTRVEQGLAYYIRFVEQYPTVKDLAMAEEDDVLKLWQGLGYYSRARNLHSTARSIVDKYDGIFPTEYKNILSLKGIGEYTAAAITSFAYNLPYAVVDGNVYRVLSRVFNVDEPIDTPKGKKVFKELADALLDKKDPGLYNQSIMEFGALQCTPSNPNCSECCLNIMCLANAENSVSELPQKVGKTKIRKRYFNYLDIRYYNIVYLQKRTEKDIWQNLYELPLIESEQEIELTDLQIDPRFKSLLNNVKINSISKTLQLKHILSHQTIFATFYQIIIGSPLENTFHETPVSEIDNYAVSRLVEKYLESTSL